MKSLTTIFKILCAVSFLFLMMPNEKFNVPMWMELYMFILGLSGLVGMILSLIMLTAFVYLLFTAFEYHKLNDRLHLSAIVVFYFPFCTTIKNLFIYPTFISWLTYIVFFIISGITLALIIKRLKLNNYIDA